MRHHNFATTSRSFPCLICCSFFPLPSLHQTCRRRRKGKKDLLPRKERKRLRFTRRQKAWLQLVGCSFCVVLSGVTTFLSAAEVETVRCVKAMPREGEQRFYAANRPPLLPSPLVKLPTGSLRPKGWRQTPWRLMADGLLGRLTELSQWCRWDGNAWANPNLSRLPPTCPVLASSQRHPLLASDYPQRRDGHGHLWETLNPTRSPLQRANGVMAMSST
jgi:hypothetical protein